MYIGLFKDLFYNVFKKNVIYILKNMYAQSCNDVNKENNKNHKFSIYKTTSKKSQFLIHFGLKSKVLDA